MTSVFMKFRPFQGPSHYTFVDPDTQHKYTAGNQAELVKQILGYRTQNRLEPIESLDTVLENYWCTLPENTGKCKHFVLKRGLLQTLKGGISLLVNFAYDKFVSQEKADARAEICVSCPHNKDVYKGRMTAWEDMIAEASVGDRKSKYQDKLFTCDVCLCPLRSKIHYGGKIDLNEEELKQMPDVCWQKKEVLSYG